MEVAEMHQSTASFVSIILLLLGGVLFLARGFGLILSKYAFVAGVVCVIISAFIDVILKTQFNDIL
jgi:hypothetical protein